MKLFLILHIIICIAVYILMRLGLLKGTRQIFPIALLIPVWGPAAVVLLEIYTRRKNFTGADTGVDRLLVEDEIYKTIRIDDSAGEKQVAPINEILTLNNPKVRRDVIMEILYENPADYIGQLQLAKNNDDTEVVHYAVTALVELQKDYDLRFQLIEKKMLDSPKDEQLKREYRDLLEQYVNSGLIEDSGRAVYLTSYSRLLSEELEKNEDYSLYLKKIDVDMELKDYESVYAGAVRMTELKPMRETGYLKLIDCCAAMKNRAGIDRVLELIKERDVYLSPKGRAAVKFWQKDGLQ